MAKNLSKLRAGMSADAQASAEAQKIRKKWPDNIKAMAGSWPDFPEAKTLRKGMGADVERESLCEKDDSAFGTWSERKSDDGLEYQEKLRSEWDDRS